MLKHFTGHPSTGKEKGEEGEDAEEIQVAMIPQNKFKRPIAETRFRPFSFH
ncbi:MAG: hypothetical protein IPH31_23070 [Lewinellaceae bacterium]|nr:hypothetical protein [Lewinellaceae bacterium]